MASTKLNELTTTTDHWNKRPRFNDSANTTTIINAQSPPTADRQIPSTQAPPISILRLPTYSPSTTTTPPTYSAPLPKQPQKLLFSLMGQYEPISHIVASQPEDLGKSLLPMCKQFSKPGEIWKAEREVSTSWTPELILIPTYLPWWGTNAQSDCLITIRINLK